MPSALYLKTITLENFLVDVPPWGKRKVGKRSFSSIAYRYSAYCRLAHDLRWPLSKYALFHLGSSSHLLPAIMSSALYLKTIMKNQAGLVDIGECGLHRWPKGNPDAEVQAWLDQPTEAAFG